MLNRNAEAGPRRNGASPDQEIIRSEHARTSVISVGGGGLTRHGMAVEVVSDGLLQLMIR